MPEQVLNYNDAVVYDTDIELFNPGCWLNDRCINFYFRHLEHCTFSSNTEFLFIDPAVVSFLMFQCSDSEDEEDLGRALGLDQRSLIFIPVNDASHQLQQGSHW
mmetsp:Transcript_21871/g.31752  ORF Transcript_21871/g.31752 Transcript_21871/m.31752 type:complete len:104 (+) Transcript_21871:67-378(+)